MSELDSKINNHDYNFTFSTKNVVITEMLEDAETSKSEAKKYFVEEPLDQFDYIFEPEHYKVSAEPAREAKTTENKFTHARVISETKDGFLEYEYQSYTYVNKNVNENVSFGSDEANLFGNDFDILCHNHLDAIIRGK